MKKPFVIAVMIIIVLLGFYLYIKSNETKSSAASSIWLVDWQSEAGIKDAQTLGDALGSVSLFGVYYTKEHDGFLPASSKKLIADSKSLQVKRYLTVVNDQIQGTKELKSAAVINSILDDPKKHQQQLIHLAKQAHVDGLELDYENIPVDKEAQYIQFIKDLQQQLDDEELALRVVIEPKFKAPLPSSSHFVIMAYNLHGPHNDAGPKANFDFLDTLAKRFPNDAKNITIAFSLGGFRFAQDGVKSLTDKDIASLDTTKAKRDTASGAMSFTAEDGSDIWYSDTETLQQWRDYMQKKGYTQFAYWRAGDVAEKTLTMLKNN